MQKFPVPRLAQATVVEWASELAAQTGRSADDLQLNTESISFPHEIVRVELMDQSVVEFRNAFFVVSEPWGLAGLWSEWTDTATGEVLPNYTMVTQNCDDVPVLNLMHRPDPKRAPDMQDKRTVVPLEKGDWDAWLHGTVEQAEALIKAPPLKLFVHRAKVPTQQVELPVESV